MNRKIYAIAAALTLSLAMTSCEEDDDEQDYVAPDALSGRWELIQVGSLNDVGALNYVDAADGCEPDEIFFEADFFSTVENTPNGDVGCLVETKSGSWVLVDGNLEFLSGMEEEFRRDVFSLTPDMMVLVYTNDEDQLKFLKYQKGI